MIHIKKRHFTLLEVLIALGLTSIVITTLTFFYMQIQTINAQTEKTMESLFQLSYLQSRLSNVLPKSISETDPKKNFFFYTSSDASGEAMKQGSPSLVFTFDNGVDLNKDLSNNTLGRLFIDNQKRLVLATWPSPQRWKDGTTSTIKKEILLDNVDNIAFSFFVAPETDRVKVIPQSATEKKQFAKPEPTLTWINEWRFEYYQLPAIMRLTLTRPTGNITYTFPLPNSNKVIYYTQ